jgi:hypothetical protein
MQAAIANEEQIFVVMANTTNNPWASQGQGPVGIAFQVFFEIYSATCLFVAIYKLHSFISSNGLQASPSQLCLIFEIGAALSNSKCTFSLI